MIIILKTTTFLKSGRKWTVTVEGTDFFCPACNRIHRFRKHGGYWHYLILPHEEVIEIKIPRFLCAVAKITISILPSICLPHSQYGAESIGVFLESYLGGASVLESLRAVAPSSESSGLGYHWLRRLQRATSHLGSYLCRLAHRASESIPASWKRPHAAVRALAGLRHGHPDLATALVAHNADFYARTHRRLI